MELLETPDKCISWDILSPGRKWDSLSPEKCQWNNGFSVGSSVGHFVAGEEMGHFVAGTICHMGRKWDILSSGTICRPKNASETMFFYECNSGTICRMGRKWDILSSGTICRPKNAGGTICHWDKMSPNLFVFVNFFLSGNQWPMRRQRMPLWCNWFGR